MFDEEFLDMDENENEDQDGEYMHFYEIRQQHSDELLRRGSQREYLTVGDLH